MRTPFDDAAREKCLTRLSKSRVELFKCRNATSFDQFHSHWADFLIHAGGVLNSIEAGTRQTAEGRQWYGGIKRRARSDPFLLYMYQARNAEEHNASSPIQNAGPEISIDGHGKTFVIGDRMVEVGGHLINEGLLRSLDGRHSSIECTPEGPRLLTVVDERYGTVFPVPDSFQGKKLSERNPLLMGELYLGYLSDVVRSIDS